MRANAKAGNWAPGRSACVDKWLKSVLLSSDLFLLSRRHPLQTSNDFASAGSDTPEYLEDLPGSYGFDPLGKLQQISNLTSSADPINMQHKIQLADLAICPSLARTRVSCKKSRKAAVLAGLGNTPSSLDRFRESELIHSRWAMAGAAGVIAVELAGQGNWYDAPLWVSAAISFGKFFVAAKSSNSKRNSPHLCFSITSA